MVESPGLEGVSATVAASKATPGTSDSGVASDYEKYELSIEPETATASTPGSEYAIDLRLLYENGFIPVKVTGMYLSSKPIATTALTNTPRPVVTATLGSPFAADCGDGVPRIWSNDSWNAVGSHQLDDHHGHVDLFVPAGCDIATYHGEFIAPFDGVLTRVQENIYDLRLPDGVYPAGTKDALRFVGIADPDLSQVNAIVLNFGHIDVHGKLGRVRKGQSLGDIVPERGHHKLAYQVLLQYAGRGYKMSPTLFLQENGPWPCVSDSPYDCVAERNDYIR